MCDGCYSALLQGFVQNLHRKENPNKRIQMEPEIQFVAGKLTFNSVKRITSSIHWSCFNLVHRVEV